MLVGSTGHPFICCPPNVIFWKEHFNSYESDTISNFVRLDETMGRAPQSAMEAGWTACRTVRRGKDFDPGERGPRKECADCSLDSALSCQQVSICGQPKPALTFSRVAPRSLSAYPPCVSVPCSTVKSCAHNPRNRYSPKI